jgi:3D (Asp-Asp-Asp) domain-containing protein
MKSILTGYTLALLAIIGFILGIFLAASYSTSDELLNPHIKTEFIPTESPEEPVEEEVSYAKVTAYSCIGLETEAEIQMNCPSLKHAPLGMTATGTTPRPYKTVACDRANLGRIFELEGIGKVKCEDTGGAINGAGRFDLYVTDVHEARQWGVRQVAYKLVGEK